jgi:hypothetical protein
MNRQVWKVVATAFVASITATSAFAESKIVTGTATASGASAKLTLKIVIPEFIALRVGTGQIYTNGGQIDEVVFTVPEDSATSNITISGAGDGKVSVHLVSNVGTVSIRSSAANLTSGSETIPLSQISVSSDNANLPHPSFGAITGTSLSPNPGSKVINTSANWTYSYSHLGGTTPVGAGNFTTEITYTAAKL